MDSVPRKNPFLLPPIGIDRAQAAAYIGVDAELFDRLVAERRMPEPRTIHDRLIWDVEEIAHAFRRLPHRASPTSGVAANNVLESANAEGIRTVYTPKTLAERWGCSEHHIRNVIDRGELPAFRARCRKDAGAEIRH